jgi:hypothetical protein
VSGARRQLTKSQLAMVAAKMLPLLEAEAKKRQATSTGGAHPQLAPLVQEAGSKGEAAAQTAAMTGASTSYVHLAKAVSQTDPDLAKRVARRDRVPGPLFDDHLSRGALGPPNAAHAAPRRPWQSGSGS